MSFKIKKIYNVESDLVSSVEQVASDLILINLELKSNTIFLDSRPIHYRFDFGVSPPLDISFDTETGLLKNITIFLDSQSISRECPKAAEVNLMNGYPCIDVELYEKHNYLVDEKCSILVTLCNETLTMQQQNRAIDNKLIINEHLQFLLDEHLMFGGLVIKNLTV